MRARDIATLSIPTGDGSELVDLFLHSDGTHLVTPAGTAFDRELFLTLRDRKGATILADDPKAVRALLRLRGNDSAVITRAGNDKAGGRKQG